MVVQEINEEPGNELGGSGELNSSPPWKFTFNPCVLALSQLGLLQK